MLCEVSYRLPDTPLDRRHLVGGSTLFIIDTTPGGRVCGSHGWRVVTGWFIIATDQSAVSGRSVHFPRAVARKVAILTGVISSGGGGLVGYRAGAVVVKVALTLALDVQCPPVSCLALGLRVETKNEKS